MTANPSGKIVQFRPKPSQLLGMVRAAAMDSANVMFSEHAFDRMEERGITTLDALRVLRGGEIKGEIEPGKYSGEWKCKITKTMKGSREIGVVTLFVNSNRLRVKTVEWEDLK